MTIETITRREWEKLGPADRATAARERTVFNDDVPQSEARIFGSDLWARLSPYAQSALRDQGARVEGETRGAPPRGFELASGGIGYVRKDA
jgi:hypothetical protein